MNCLGFHIVVFFHKGHPEPDGHYEDDMMFMRWAVLESYAEGEGPDMDEWFRTFERGGAPIKFTKELK